MRQQLNYNIHDIMHVCVNTSSRPVLKGLNEMLSFFKVDDITESDIEINIGKFAPKNNNCRILDHKYYVKDNYFYCKDHSGPGRWQVEIFGFEEPPVVVNFHGKVRDLIQFLAPDFLAQDLVLYPCVESFLGFRGFFLAHAAGIANDSGCCIFVGPRGTSKTTLALAALRARYKILGEERVILDTKGNSALSFPVNFQIFESLIELGTSEYLNHRQKLLLAFKLLKHKRPNESIWQHKPARVRAIFFLERKAFLTQEVTIKPLKKEIAVKKFTANNVAEMYASDVPSVNKSFSNYLNAYSFVFPWSKISGYWNGVEKKLLSFVKSIDEYEVTLPYKGVDFRSFLDRYAF